MKGPIDLKSLHGSLSDPHMATMSFLNEVMRRYPRAISFAPGAPNPIFHDDFSPWHYYERFVKHLSERDTISLQQARARTLEYGPSIGIINDLVSAALEFDGLASVAPNELVITVGAQEALVLALRALFVDDSDILAITSPCYAGVMGAAKLLNIETIPVPEVCDGPDLNALLEHTHRLASAGKRVRALYVAPDFANPSGIFMSETARVKLTQFASAQSIFLLEDSAYTFTRHASDAASSLMSLDRTSSVLQVGTFSKVAFPGMRVGYLAAKQQVRSGNGTTSLAELIAAAKSMLTVNTSPLAQAVIGGMLLEHRSTFALAQSRAILYRENLRHLVRCLDCELSELQRRCPAIKWSRPAGGFFVCLTVPMDANEDLLRKSAEEFGVLWTPMRYFHLTGAGDQQIRLSCSFLTRSEIEEGIRRLAALLRSAFDD